MRPLSAPAAPPLAAARGEFPGRAAHRTGAAGAVGHPRHAGSVRHREV